MNYELKALENKVMKIDGKQELLKWQLSDIHNAIESAKNRKELLEEAMVGIQECAQRTQNKIKERFEAITQSALDVVFPDEYRFHFDFVPRRGKTEVDIWLEKNGNRMNPMNSNGGGIVDVISISLRVACLTMSSFDKVILLDEPFAHLRGLARNRLGEVLDTLSHKIGIQVIMVGDVAGSSMKADKEFNVTKNNGVSKVAEVDLSDR